MNKIPQQVKETITKVINKNNNIYITNNNIIYNINVTSTPPNTQQDADNSP